jgi:hypothetical protein
MTSKMMTRLGKMVRLLTLLSLHRTELDGCQGALDPPPRALDRGPRRERLREERPRGEQTSPLLPHTRILMLS